MADDIRSDIIINIDTSVGIAEIKNLQRQISQLNAQLLQSGARQARAAQDIQNNLIKNINATGKFAANVRSISTTAESFTTALERNKLSMGEYFRYAGASTKTFGRLFKNEFDTIEKVARERVKTLQTQYIKLGRDANGALKAIAVRPLALDMDNLATKTALAAQKQQLFNQLLKQGSTNLLNFGKNTQWAGRQLMVGFSIPLAYMGAAAAREFKKIEQQAIRFKRVYGDAFDTEYATDKALENMQRLATEFTKYGIEVSKTLELAADAAQMGLTGADLTAQVTEATRLAVLGEVEQQEALEATISVTNAFGVAAEDLASKINFLNAVENETITAINDLTIAIPKAGPVVKQLGGDVEDLAFFLTAMKEGGINASEGANALKSGLASLINPTDKAAAMLQGMGINLREIVEVNKGNVSGIVIDFAKALDTLDPLSRARAIEQLFGKFQFSRLSTLFQNVIKDGNQASRVLKLATQSSQELAIIAERELRRVEESPLFKFQKQLEQFQAALAPLGAEFMKAITPILEFGTDLLKRFNGMSDGAKQFAVVATTVVAGIGPVFLMMFGLIANGAANIIKLFANLLRIFTGVGKGSKDLGLSTEYMTQQQLEAAAVASSLNQSHSKLIQTFTAEAGAVNNLATSYARAVVQQSRLLGINPETGAPIVPAGKRVRPKKLAKGIMSVPGPKGAGDIVPAMLSPGEAIIPAKQSQKYAGLIQGMINDNIPGYRFGRNPFGGLIKAIKPKGTKYNILEGFLRLLTGQRTGEFGSNTDIYRDLMAKKFVRSKPNVAVRIPFENLKALAQSKDKRYKSVFETGFSQAGDTPAKRIIAEQRLFGLPGSMDPSKRPVYGYLFRQERGLKRLSEKRKGGGFKQLDMSARIFESLTGTRLPIINTTSRASEKRLMFGNTGSLMNPKTFRYGNLAMILKRRAIKNKTTFTYGDSYQSWGDRYAKPAPLGTISSKRIRAAYTSRDKDFFEAQIMGGFSLKDVKRIVTTEPALIPQIQNLLRANGINIPVGMPKFSMMQRLQKLIYGKKMYQDRLPFTAKYGPKAGKYTNPPVKVGNRRVWLNKGTGRVKKIKAPKGTQSSPGFLTFDQDAVLEAAHMSGGTSALNKTQLRRLFERQLESADRAGLLAKFGKNKEDILKGFNDYLKNQKGSRFSLFSNVTEPVLKELNQKFSRTENLVKASFIKESLDRTPDGLLGSGIRSRLPENHGIPNSTLNKYGKDLADNMKAMLSQLGDREIREKDLHKIYRKAEELATSKIKNLSHRAYLADLNNLSRHLLTPALINSTESGSGKSRSPLASLFGNVQDKTLSAARASFPQFLTKNSIMLPGDLRAAAQAYAKTLSRDERLAFYRLLIEESEKKGQKNYKKIIEDAQGGRIASVADKPKPKPKAPKNIFSMKRILSVGRLGSLAALGGIAGLLFGGSDVLKAANGVFSVPGPKGAGDIVPAMLSPGESVIPARQSEKYAPLVQAMISDSVPGYEDGRPAYQDSAGRWRDSKGRYTAAPQQQAQGRSIGGRVATGASVAGMAAMAYGMSGQPGSDIAMMASMPLMMAPMLAPLLKAHPIIAGVTLALTALVVGFVAVQNAINKVRDEAFDMKNKLDAGQKSMKTFAEFAGNVSASEYAQKIRKERLSPFTVAPGKTTFGQAFVQSEAGQKQVSDIRSVVSNLGRSEAIKRVQEQLLMAITTKALSADQARSVAQSIGQQLNDYTFSTQVLARINQIIGPDGKPIVGNTIKLYADIIQRSTEGLTGEGGLLQGENLTGGDPIWWWDTEKVAKAEGEAAAWITQVYDKTQSVIDSLDMEMLPQIDLLRDQGKFDEAAKLEETYYNRRADLVAQREAAIQKIRDDFNKTGFYRQTAIVEKMQATTRAQFEGQAGVQSAIDKLKNSWVANKNKITFFAELQSGNISPEAFEGLINKFDPKNTKNIKTLNLIAEISTKLGAGSADQLNLITQGMGEEDARNFILNFDIKDPAKAQKALDAFSLIARYDEIGGYDVTATLQYYQENPKALEDFQKDVDAMKKLSNKGELTIESVIDQKIITNEEAIERLKLNTDYFNSLPPEQQLTYLITYTSKFNAIAEDEIAAWRQSNPELGKYLSNDEIAARIAGDVAYQYTEATTTDTTTGEEGEPPKDLGGTKKNELDDIFDRLKRVRNAAIDGKRTIKELIDLMKSGSATTTLFRGTDQKLLFAGYSKQFIDSVMQMDEKTRDKYVKIKNGIMTVTAAGKALNKAFSEISLGDFQLSLISGVADVNKQITAMNKLTAQGMSVDKAFELVQDSALAYAIATNATTKEVKDLVKWQSELIKKQEELQKSTPSGMQEYLANRVNEVTGALSIVDEYFAAREEQVEQDFAQGTNLSGKNIGLANIGTITKNINNAQQDIANYQDTIDDLNYQLSIIDEQEIKINEEYDKRLEALDKIEKANEAISAQQKTQLTLADALSQGDISAAARAVQEIRAQSAAENIASQRDLLEQARQRSLEAISVSINGKMMTRKQIEEEIAKISKNIAKIEEEKLEINQKLLRDAEALKASALEAIGTEGYLGKTKTEWNNIENAVKLAVVQSDAFKASILGILAAIKGFKFDANGNLIGFDDKSFKDSLPVAPGTLKPPAEGFVWDEERGGWVPPAGTGFSVGEGGKLTQLTNPNQAKIDELNRLRKISREKFQNSKDAAYRARLMELNIKRGEEIQKLGGVALATGGMVPKKFAMGGKVRYYPMGGLIPYKAEGGSIFKPLGTDTVPAMLTPGEFVVRKYAVDNFGVDRLKAINSGTYSGDSVYNYDVSVNVQTDANPDQIARAVIGQIRQIESQRIRGNRF
jgi:TP901 family phage tail tape measure protein